MKKELTVEQIGAIEGVIQRRMANTGETREQAIEHVVHYLTVRRHQSK